jgi:hypothetical protein
VADLYTLIFNKARSSNDFAHGREGLFFGANGEHKLYDLAEVPSPKLVQGPPLIVIFVQAIGQALVALRRLGESKPMTLTDAEIQKFFGPAPAGPKKAVCPSHTRAWTLI